MTDFMKTIYHRFLFLLIISSLATIGSGQCDQSYDWAVWSDFSGNSANGTITQSNQTIAVEMVANYEFDATPGIFNYSTFNGFNNNIPNITVPRTTWTAGAGGETTMCFSETVINPVLLLSSIGSPGTPVTLELSIPYISIYDGGGMTFVNETTILGEEGYTVLLFPGNFECITIFSTTPEYYTNLTWGLNPPLFPVSIVGDLMACDSVSLMASGGDFYEWSGGDAPNLASNTFLETGNYFLTVTDEDGCTVVTSVSIEVDMTCYDCAGTLYGSAVIDICGECLEPTDPNFNQTCPDCNGTPNGTAIIDDCGECHEPTDSDFNNCLDCAGIPFGGSVIDDCGVCLEPIAPDFNNCFDCSGVPFGTAVIDYCGVCNEPDDPNFNQSCDDENQVYIPNVFSPDYDGINPLADCRNPDLTEAQHMNNCT